MFDVAALGEVLIDFTPSGKSEHGNPRFDQNAGGAPANVLAALSKLGKRTAFIGKVGQDAFGDHLVETLLQAGIDTSGMVRSKEAHTTLAFVHLNDQGDRSFSFCRNPGADMLLEAGELHRDVIGNSRVFHFGSISMTHEPALSATREALRIAKERGILISFDPNLRIPLWPSLEQAKERMFEGLEAADVVKISEEELEFLTGTDDLEAGSKQLTEKYGIKLLLVTLGEKGCFYRLGGGFHLIPGFRVQAVDTTGAGDSFLAGVLYGLLEREGLLEALTEMELQQILVFANALGALVTTRKGAIPALPELDEIVSLTEQAPVTDFSEPFRSQFHFTPEGGWLNDPNGMVFFEGEYHLFYQHHPWSSKWGPMHWGHAVSRDLVHWEHLPIALKPDGNGYIFSGSAVVDWKDSSGLFDGGPGLVAVFTHADTYPATGTPRQRQSIAYSRDKGRTWTMYGNNPVLADERIEDFRDPKVFWHEPSGRWVMVLAAGNHARLYTSPNLIDWTYGSSFGEAEGSHDGVWECPDLFELPVEGEEERKRWVLLVSIGDQNQLPEGSRTQYFIGDFDGERFVNENPPETVLWLDHGRDNYAGVSWSDIPAADGRRIYLGWMSNWQYANLTPTKEWKSAMTIPRTITLRKNGPHVRVVQTPVRELESLRGNPISWSNETIGSEHHPLKGFRGTTYELEAEFELGTAVEFGLKLRCSGPECTVVGYEVLNNEIFIDRTRSGINDFHSMFACKHSAALSPDGKTLKLHLFVDRSSVELFAQNGQLVMTDQIFPELSGDGVALYAREGTVKLASLTIHELASIYGQR